MPGSASRRSACRSSSRSGGTERRKWSFRKLFRFAFDGITSFSTVPLRVWTYLGGLISVLAIADGRLFRRSGPCSSASTCAGYPSLIVSITFFSGVQLMSLGIIGEYIGRIFAEVKRRPLYVVAERIGDAAEASQRRDQSATSVAPPREP